MFQENCQPLEGICRIVVRSKWVKIFSKVKNWTLWRSTMGRYSVASPRGLQSTEPGSKSSAWQRGVLSGCSGLARGALQNGQMCDSGSKIGLGLRFKGSWAGGSERLPRSGLDGPDRQDPLARTDNLGDSQVPQGPRRELRKTARLCGRKMELSQGRRRSALGANGADSGGVLKSG